MPNGKNKKALPSRHWDESGKRFVVPPKFGPMRPFLLLVRGARRGCFHPRSFAVLTGSLPRRAFSPRARLSAAAVWRLLLRGQHGYTLLYAICRGLSSRRVYFLCSYAVKGLLLGLTMSRPLSPPAVLPHAPSLPARRGGRPCPRNTAQRCHSEPVRRLAWESVPLASLCEGGVTAFASLCAGGRDGRGRTPPLHTPAERAPLPRWGFQRGGVATPPLWSFQGDRIFKERGKSKSPFP